MERGRVVERHQSLFLLLTERGYGDNFFDVRQTGNLRSGSFELTQSYFLLTAEPLNKWSPNRLKAMEPPARCRLPFSISHR